MIPVAAFLLAGIIAAFTLRAGWRAFCDTIRKAVLR